MALPMIGRHSDAKVLEESGRMLARLAMMAADGNPHGNPYYAFNPNIGYPTRRNVEAWFLAALGPRDAKDTGREFPLAALFAEAWEHVDADEGEDEAAKALLGEYFARILPEGEVWTGEAIQVQSALAVLASFAPDALWVLAVQKAFPKHPQTPGSDRWNQVEATGGPHESSANPFVGRGGY